jgi:hypothetical protein
MAPQVDIVEFLLPRNRPATDHLINKNADHDEFPTVHMRRTLSEDLTHKSFENFFEMYLDDLADAGKSRAARQLDTMVLRLDPPISAPIEGSTVNARVRLEGTHARAWTPLRRAVHALQNGFGAMHELTSGRRLQVRREAALKEGLGEEEVDVHFVLSMTLDQRKQDALAALFPQGSEAEEEQLAAGVFQRPVKEGVDKKVLDILGTGEFHITEVVRLCPRPRQPWEESLRQERVRASTGTMYARTAGDLNERMYRQVLQDSGKRASDSQCSLWI